MKTSRVLQKTRMPMMVNDLKDEMEGRKEAQKWELEPCRCCGGTPQVLEWTTIKIACGRHGCFIVEGKTMKEAADLWNSKDFRYPHHD